MELIPFGIDRLDSTIGGGAPQGSVVLLSGEAGAGAREFMYTTAVMNGLAQTGDDLFGLHYGDLEAGAALPGAIHYLSFTHERDQIEAEIDMSMDEEIGRRGFEEVEFVSLSQNYFHRSPVPRSWYAEETADIRSLRKRHEEREKLLSALGDTVSRRAPGNLVLIDSFSDLVAAAGDTIEWSDINYVTKGLAKAAHEWGALILIHVNFETLTEVQHGQLIDNCSGTLQFQWETGGSTRARTLVVKNFRGVLSQLESENIVKFETDLSEAGFDISDVRKIR
ncbi:RAD55 family ATPase [Halovenus salina]|uniref:RAD55 family ATPase n=1 Tax=Halovenus salina TaxID=1510225 RepID=UPI0022608B56|nr:HTR-like protein [Halovenus salina]